MPALTELDAGEDTLAYDRTISSGLALYAKGSTLKLDRKVRREMLAAIAGDSAEVPELEFDATTFVQRPEPNRNFVRFKNGALGALGRSYKTAPFLKNHDTDDTEARGGTALDSKTNKLDGEITTFDMRIEPVKLWAITGILDGTIDRFSIGWARSGPVECSIHKAPVFTKCACWLGDEIDGDVVEYVITSAVGTEVSAVNVPAVVGTGITGITRLSALDQRALKSILAAGSPLPTKEELPMPVDAALLAQLGLPATATMADVTAAIARLNMTSAQTRDQLAAALRDGDAAEQTARRGAIDAAVSQLCSTGKLAPGGASEVALRGIAAIGEALASTTDAERAAKKATLAQSLGLFQAQCAALAAGPSITATGAPLAAATKDPVPVVAAAPLGGGATVLTADAQLEANPGLRTWLRQAGITKEEFEKHGQLGRFMVGQGMFERAPAAKS